MNSSTKLSGLDLERHAPWRAGELQIQRNLISTWQSSDALSSAGHTQPVLLLQIDHNNLIAASLQCAQTNNQQVHGRRDFVFLKIW